MRVLAFLIALLTTSSAHAASCKDGKTAESITSSITSWVPSSASVYASAAANTWLDASGDGLRLNSSSYESCLDAGIYSAGLTPPKDADTYFNCTDPEHGFPGTGPCYPYHPGGSPSGVAPNNPAGQIIERATLRDQGDGVSLLSGAGTVQIRGSRFIFIHDDAVEDDFCEERVVVIDDNYFNKVFMAFAFDLREDETPCSLPDDKFWMIRNNIVDLHRFAHAYKERPGHGGLFKDDGTGVNPVMDFTDNVVLLGPVAGDQLYYPARAWIDGDECAGNVYLWDGITQDFNNMLALDANAANRTSLQESTFPDCIVEVLREDVCGSCTSATFLNTPLPELGNVSYNQLTSAWVSSHFPTGCGMGFELVGIIPVLSWLRRRRPGRGRS